MTRMDILRKVLYGGYRSTDTAGKTVLERAYFPTDAHSFAKVYSGSDLGDLTPFTGSATTITICNTTPAASGNSQNVTNPPLMRVANGDFSKWAANERWQCTWDGEKTTDPVSAHSPNDNDPDKSSDGLTSNGAGPDYNVRVEVCDNNVLNASNCTKYTDSSGNSDFKPTGLLQTYGETGKIKFGLMTGSYTKSKSGGVLRKNISDFSNEVDPSNGTFTNVNGIVSTINALRMHGYNNSDGTYNNDDSCKWGLSSFTEPNCSNWGNPISEMYLEAVRYFNGQNTDSDFSTDDSSYIPGVNGVPGLSTATWSHPLNKDNYCAKCSIIVLNTGPFSYDSDQIDSGFANLNGGTPSAETLTKDIGDWEKITNNKYFIGNNGTTNDGLCTAKTITDLSLALGPCPDLPRLGGSYDIAGIAYWAHTNNVNSSSGLPANADQTVNTYAVSLSSTTPVVNIPVPGSSTQTVKLMPACRNSGTSPATDCRIVDMQITKPYTVVSGTATGQIYVNWEDSEQGGDFDQDMWGTIDYSIDSSGITITTQVSYESTSYPMGFGYVISGTTNDGFHVTSGIHDFKYTDASISNTCGSAGNTCDAGAAATKVYYPLGSTTAGILKDPLWYAAKYGGFTDYSGTPTAGTDPITSSAQWDTRNNTTNAIGSDGLPDNYFNSANPGNLETNLGQVLANITEQVSSGTAAAVVANAGSGAGMIVQALYQPVKTNSSTNPVQRVTWVGRLYSLFVDSHNNLREDSNQNGKLDDYATDDVVSLVYDKSSNETKIARYDTTNGIDLTLNSYAPLSDLKPIWSARDQLAAITNSTIPTQRNYTDTIDSTHGRYIFTWIDSNNNGVVDSGEVIPFTDQSITASNFGWLDLQSDFNGDNKIDVNDADDLVNFIRGEDGIDNFRSRTIDYDNSGVDKVWRLGDIIHSTPLIVGTPSSNWDDKYGDTSYTAFKKQYASRRVVVYTGANDGMLHAFNSGFYDALNKKYCIAPLAVPSGSPAGTAATCPSNATGDPLGSELWGYVPGNLLPHLQWLAEKDYPHVYYVDGTPQAFDVNIFPDDATHPGGWGTILVVGMRLGGGDMSYTPVSGTNVTSRSAYMIMDITDPEQPPKLLGEISDPSLGFTTSTPSLMVRRAPGTGNDWTNPSVNEWYLVFGSGPTDLSTVTSAQNASLYVLNLKTMQFVKGFPEDLKIKNSFVGDVNSIDWTNDYKTDAAYFGIAGGGTSTPTGQLMRMVLTDDTKSTATSWPVSTVINPGQPFVNRPEFAVDDQNKWWVYDGTGRLYVSGDAQSTELQSFYGIKEQVDSATGLPSGTTAYRTSSGGSYYLQNTTGVQVGLDGTIYDINGVLPSTVTNFYGSTGLISDIAGKAGWYINLVPDTANTPANPIPATGSERNLGNSLLFRQLMLFTTFTPNSNSCAFDGSSKLYGVYYKTGTAYPNAGLGNKTCSNCATGVDVSESSIGLEGATTTGGVILSVGSDNAKIYLTGIHGQGYNPPVTGVPTPTGRQSWREIIPQ
ncbi:MAG: PilC/PilY family type IV pilus protein [Gammaproteobacteria bacterium]